MRISVLVLVAVLVAAALFIVIKQPGWTWTLRGYPPADQPAKALQLYVQAIKLRHYDAAARYCTDDYAKLLKEANSSAKKLGKTLDYSYDTLTNRIEATATQDKHQVQRCQLALLSIDPFPKATLSAGDVHKDPLDKYGKTYWGQLVWEGIDLGQVKPEDYRMWYHESPQGAERGGSVFKVHPLMMNVLVPGGLTGSLPPLADRLYLGAANIVKIVAKQEGKHTVWKLDIPVVDRTPTKELPESPKTGNLAGMTVKKSDYRPAVWINRDALEIFRKRNKVFTQALVNFQDEMKREVTTKTNVEGRLRDILDEANKGIAD